MSEFRSVWRLVDGILDSQSDEDIMRILHRRCLCKDEGVSEDILGVAEAADVLAKGDRRELLTAKKQQETKQSESVEFRDAWVKKRRELVRSDPRAQASARGSASSSSSSGRRSAAALRTDEVATIEHKTIADLAPTGCSVWRDHGKGRWHIHFPPYARFSRPWDLHSEAGAAFLVLKRAWRLHLEDSGRPLSECPVTGLFTGDQAKDKDHYIL